MSDGAADLSLTLKEVQGGVVGWTGSVWTIAPDCSFTVSRIFNTEQPAHRRGQLTPEQQAFLSRILTEKLATSLPQRLGGPIEVNPHVISLTYGGRTSELNWPLGKSIDSLKALEPSNATRRFLEIAEAVKQVAGGMD